MVRAKAKQIEGRVSSSAGGGREERGLRPGQRAWRRKDCQVGRWSRHTSGKVEIARIRHELRHGGRSSLPTITRWRRVGGSLRHLALTSRASVDVMGDPSPSGPALPRRRNLRRRMREARYCSLTPETGLVGEYGPNRRSRAA